MRAHYCFNDIIGFSALIRDAVRIAKIASESCSNLLINGESGTGKELFAQAIHNASSRASGSFVAVNCSAIPSELVESELFGFVKGSFTGAVRDTPGKFEQAHKGTLFLDEIGEMPITTQAKLLRVIQERELTRIGDTRARTIDVRIISATHKDLFEASEKMEFRQDLFYRLQVLTFTIPPLRRRPEDIVPLIQYFIDRYAQKIGKNIRSFSDDFMKACEKYRWPGNVRELQNIIEREIAMSSHDTEQITHIPDILFRKPAAADEILPMWQIEKNAIERTIRHTGGNLAHASRILEIGRASLYRKIKQYGISV